MTSYYIFVSNTTQQWNTEKHLNNATAEHFSSFLFLVKRTHSTIKKKKTNFSLLCFDKEKYLKAWNRLLFISFQHSEIPSYASIQAHKCIVCVNVHFNVFSVWTHNRQCLTEVNSIALVEKSISWFAHLQCALFYVA